MCKELKQHDNISKSCNENLSMTSLSGNRKIFVQTLREKLISDKQGVWVRVVIDTGTQKPYILREVAENVKYVSLQYVTAVHTLFGGINTESYKHRCYKIKLGKLDESCIFLALDQPVICESIKPMQTGPWLVALNKKKILLTDVGHQWSNSNSDRSRHCRNTTDWSLRNTINRSCSAGDPSELDTYG